jgi:tetratricopeptide (TPR) repeat protein
MPIEVANEPQLGAQTLDLGVSPFPRALASLWRQEASGTLAVRQQNLRKRILLRGGVPVFAESNNVDESLGRLLVKRGLISESAHVQALTEAVETERELGEVLVEHGQLSPFDLFSTMRRCFGTCILDAFRWQAGTLTFDPHEPELEGKIVLRVEPAALIVRGVVAQSPLEVIRRDSLDIADAPLVLAHGGLERLQELKLAPAELRLARALAAPTSVAVLMAQSPAVAPELILRLVYALRLLDLVMTAEEAAAQEPAPVAPAREAAPAPAPAQAQAQAAAAEESPAIVALSRQDATAIDEAFLVAKTRDYYELLGVRRAPNFRELRSAFLTQCERFSPAAHRGRDLGEQQERLEELFLTLVRAFSTLADSTARAAYDEGLAAKRAKSPRDEGTTAPRDAAPEGAFAIRTDLLDAKTHLQNGIKLFNGRRPAEALKHFEFAANLEADNPVVVAYLGFCEYAVHGDGRYDEAVERLKQAVALREDCAVAHFFLGRIHEGHQNFEQAMRSFSKCLRYQPEHAKAKEAVARVRPLLLKK